MKHFSHRPSLLFSRRGTALVVTVFFVALLTLMVVAYFESAKFDHTSAGGHLDRTKAGLFAREGMERVIATLQRETVDPARAEGQSVEDHTRLRRNWLTQPGALIVPNDPPADQKLLARRVELSSGAPLATTYSDPIFQGPDLNAPMVSESLVSTRLITDRVDPATGEPVALRLKWVYVRQNSDTGDRSFDFAEEPVLTDAANPLVGRFAYWADDESSKINYNLAWKRNLDTSSTSLVNRNPKSHPSWINLTALSLPGGTGLTEAMADALHQWTVASPARYFNTFADARQLEPEVPGLSDMLAYNKFELTHYNHDPDTTFFGEERIMLTTNRDLVPKNPDGSYARKFIDIMRDDVAADESDPGDLDFLAGGQQDWLNDPTGQQVVPNKFDAVVRDLLRYISEKNWPIAPGVSFKDKYYPGSLDSDIRLAQIIVNIIDYVRAKESSLDIIAPLRFGVAPDGKYTLHATHAYAATDSYQGVSRSPYFTELGMYVEKDPTPQPTPRPAGWPAGKSLYKCYYTAEFYLPESYGVEEGIDLVPDLAPQPAANSSMGWVLGITGVSANSHVCYFPSPRGNLVNMQGTLDAVRIFRSDLTGGEGPNQTMLMPGKRVVVTKMFYRDKSYVQQPNANVRMAAYRSTTNLNGILTSLGRRPRLLLSPQSGSLNYRTSDPSTTPMSAMLTLETDDPRANGHSSDWQPNTAGANSLGNINSRSTLGRPPLDVKPQQDTDANGLLTDASLYMPPPKGFGVNDAQNDNGLMSSVGELGYVVTGTDAYSGSTPWRTLRLQPNNYPDASVLPDWALLDLFTVPNSFGAASNEMLKPHGTSVGGRINVNSHVLPFEHLARDRGLVALVAGSSALRHPASEVASNIYHQVLADGEHQKGKVYGYPWTAASGGGDLGNAYDTPGEICEIKGVADGGEASEALMREIASLITTRGGVFSIYTVGQSLKQTRNGRLRVTAEQRQQAVVERYLNNRNTQNPNDDEVQFRTIYFRNLMP
ncbi:hypothetical protein FEM03_19915 [Phragmitibacter flavus]|uniref:Verru_Chthon cassette protein A n=1 Tax=Phragmitibacter flavus TaxID=2576071 RepID=A0A5R8KBJ2_9BACT|nr:hypothetical protein [Phragmitibacter flavus]TLD68929.1 hypothetical protein FEM03_19915 [Phragmitibacter flavus]